MRILEQNLRLSPYVATWQFFFLVIALGLFLTSSTEGQSVSYTEQRAVAGISTNINIQCNLDRQTAPPFWIINGTTYELFSIPFQFLSGIIPVVNSYSALTIPIVTTHLDNIVFQCVVFTTDGVINGSITRLIVEDSIRKGLKSFNNDPEIVCKEASHFF